MVHCTKVPIWVGGGLRVIDDVREAAGAGEWEGEVARRFIDQIPWVLL